MTVHRCKCPKCNTWFLDDKPDSKLCVPCLFDRAQQDAAKAPPPALGVKVKDEVVTEDRVGDG